MEARKRGGGSKKNKCLAKNLIVCQTFSILDLPLKRQFSHMNLKSENLLTFYSAANKGGNMLSNLQHEFGMREFADHFFAKSKGTILNCQLSVQRNIFNDNTHHVNCKNFNFLNCLFDCSGNLSKPRAADQVRRGGNHLRRGQLHRHSRSGKDIFSPPPLDFSTTQCETNFYLESRQEI